ncbi:MAG: PqqD family peptide modification chaperone [Leptolyngbyaceae bacterium]|nr:PqqD family peptide modification chaperone [Leptolyngbyaceae bacterium]
MISDDSVLVAATEQLSSSVSEEIVILNLKSGAYYGLNATGSRIWDLIQEPKSVRDIRDILLKEYDVDADVCESALYSLLKELSISGLVEVRNEAPA